ncbi:MAG: hypothetical protein WC175_03535 [Candidatus Dojkabacteria bacterium]
MENKKLKDLITWDNETEKICICGVNINDEEDLKKGIDDSDFGLLAKF